MTALITPLHWVANIAPVCMIVYAFWLMRRT